MRSSIEPEQPQSILVAEFNAPYDKAYDQPRYHTALLLRNDRDAHPGILYQLHFNGLKENPLDELLQRLVMVPNIRAGMKSSSFKKLARATKVADGYEFHTRQMWNHILRHALWRRRSSRPGAGRPFRRRCRASRGDRCAYGRHRRRRHKSACRCPFVIRPRSCDRRGRICFPG